MSAGKGHTTRPFSWAKWDASKLWKKPNMNTPITDEILALLPGGQTCDPQAVADVLRPEIEGMERDSYEWMDLIGSEVANLRAELANERVKLARWEDELSAVMPPDFKDWWQNSREEWPMVARMVIEGSDSERDILERQLAAEREQIKANHAATLLIEQMLYKERALADKLAGEIESWASIAGDYTPMSADKAIAAWQQARNPAQTTGEGAE